MGRLPVTVTNGVFDSMRVLHLTPALFGRDGGFVGGAERYAFELARHMAATVPTTLLSFGSRNREESLGALKIVVVRGNPWMREERSWPLPRRLLRELARADVVHCHQQHVLAHSLVALIGRALRRRIFVSDLGGGGWDISAYMSTDRWFTGHLHISEYSRSIFGHGGEPWAHVIWGGVDTELFTPGAETDRDGSAVFVGRLLPHKGVHDLIDAVGPDQPLRVIGERHDPEFFQDLVRKAEGKRVSFYHGCRDEELLDAYRKALCVVLPSVYQHPYGEGTKVPELLGLTLLEGMACGIPGICTKVASLPELVEDGATGFTVPPNDPETLGDRIRWLRDHPSEAQRMGTAARQRVLERFTWPAVVRRCLAIYREASK